LTICTARAVKNRLQTMIHQYTAAVQQDIGDTTGIGCLMYCHVSSVTGDIAACPLVSAMYVNIRPFSRDGLNAPRLEMSCLRPERPLSGNWSKPSASGIANLAAATRLVTHCQCESRDVPECIHVGHSWLNICAVHSRRGALVKS
jgi:hypothetical protein